MQFWFGDFVVHLSGIHNERIDGFHYEFKKTSFIGLNKGIKAEQGKMAAVREQDRLLNFRKVLSLMILEFFDVGIQLKERVLEFRNVL